mgnify:FL=1
MSAEEILNGLRRQLLDHHALIARGDSHRIPDPATWLDGQGWDAEPELTLIPLRYPGMGGTRLARRSWIRVCIWALVDRLPLEERAGLVADVALEYRSGERRPITPAPVERDNDRGQEWRALAESIRKRDGRACRRCPTTEAENGERLSVDHIIPWWVFTDKADANDPSNLMSLCRRCHSLKTAVDTTVNYAAVGLR